ncbi:hypothetical protein F5141DRAFT_1014111 [Pisolithus sp. B1]|nr:hypothetical protein F5141DRAFT_1014111 [Pisolithus sp. B1]
MFTPIPPKPISIADGCTIHATGHGDIVIKLPRGSEHVSITLKDVLLALDIAFTLISTTQIADANYLV